MSPRAHTCGEKVLSMRVGFGGHIDGNELLDLEPKSEGSQGRSMTQNTAE